MALIITTLKGMAVDIREIKANQQMIIQHFRANDLLVDISFISKQNLKLPFKNLYDFNKFDTSLSAEKDEIQREFVSIV